MSQDLSGFFTSIPTERFHQAVQVLLHRHGQVVGLQVKSDHRRRMFKGKWRRQTKIPRIFHAEDLQMLLDFVIDNSHFEINGHLFRQERGVAMGSPAAPPLCNLVATVEDYFWHQTMTSLRFRLPDFGVLCTIASHFCETPRRPLQFSAIFSHWNFIDHQFSSRHNMTPKCSDTCVTPCQERLRHNYRNIHHR